jgi:hypothetical protein
MLSLYVYAGLAMAGPATLNASIRKLPGSAVHAMQVQIEDDPDLRKRIETLESRVGFSVTGGRPAPTSVVKDVELILGPSQAADFGCYAKPRLLDKAFLSKYWAVPSPEATELQKKVSLLMLRSRHYATGDCMSERDYVRGQEVISEMISGYPQEAREAKLFSVKDGFDMLARMKKLPKADWSKSENYRKLLSSSNLSFRIVPGSVKLLRAPYVYAEADESWYWVLHDRQHKPIGGNYVYYIVPYVLKIENGAIRLYGSGTFSASESRTGVSLRRLGRSGGGR